MHGVEAVSAAHEIRRGLRRAAYARQLHHVLRLDVETPGRLDDGRGYRIVAAARAQRRQRAFVIAPREAERGLGQRRVADLRFRQESHAAPPEVFAVAGTASGLRVLGSTSASTPLTMNSEEIGNPL